MPQCHEFKRLDQGAVAHGMGDDMDGLGPRTGNEIIQKMGQPPRAELDDSGIRHVADGRSP